MFVLISDFLNSGVSKIFLDEGNEKDIARDIFLSLISNRPISFTKSFGSVSFLGDYLNDRGA